MKRKLRFLFPLTLLSMVLSGCNFITIVKNDDSGDVDVDPAVLEKYYNGCNLKERGAYLMVELQNFMFKKHTVWVPYGQVNSYYTRKTSSAGKVLRNSVEAIADKSEINQWFYTGKEAGSYGTREHVWPCANSSQLWYHTKPAEGAFDPHYVDQSNYVGGGSDLFHIRTANTQVNTARGNSKFVDFDDPEFADQKDEVVSYGENNGKYQLKLLGAKKTSTGGYQYADKCEPDDNMKGDIARIITYIYMHYSDIGLPHEGAYTSGGKQFNYTDMVGTLSLANIMGYDSEERAAEELIEWNQIDPPSNVEKLRNNTVQGIQGNRNPFVDYPELVERILG